MNKRFIIRIFALAAVLVLAAASAACAEFDLITAISGETGSEVPESAVQLIQKDLYQTTVNGVEITIQEAAYDGRTLFLQYRFRMPDVDRPLGLTAAEYWGEEIPEGTNPGEYVYGLAEGAEEELYNHHVGWWIDDIWFDGQPMNDMPDGSGQYLTGTDVPGELIEDDIWRLDTIGIYLEGKVQISLPIGDRQDISDYYDHPEKCAEDGSLLLPEQGMVTFEFDTKDILSSVRITASETETVLPDATFKVREAVFSPVMTYIKLDMTVNPDALAAFIAENGESFLGEDGEPLWEYGPMDVFGECLESMQLADGSGTVIFPDVYGPSMYSDTEAEFLMPYLETIPDALYLVPVSDDGVADMSRAVPVPVPEA